MNTTPEHTATGSADYRERQALFRSHARAALTGDTTKAARLQQRLWPDHLLAHHAFTFALFATCIGDHFGDDLDWARLDLLTERLRHTAPGVSPLKTEALIRACYDEPHLLTEIPQSEHPAIIWAACRLIVSTDHTESADVLLIDLEDLFDRAEAFGRDIARGVFTAAQRYAWQAETKTETP